MCGIHRSAIVRMRKVEFMRVRVGVCIHIQVQIYMYIYMYLCKHASVYNKLLET